MGQEETCYEYKSVSNFQRDDIMKYLKEGQNRLLRFFNDNDIHLFGWYE